jgi:hypothetical protein
MYAGISSRNIFRKYISLQEQTARYFVTKHKILCIWASFCYVSKWRDRENERIAEWGQDAWGREYTENYSGCLLYLITTISWMFKFPSFRYENRTMKLPTKWEILSFLPDYWLSCEIWDIYQEVGGNVALILVGILPHHYTMSQHRRPSLLYIFCVIYEQSVSVTGRKDERKEK